MKYETKLALQIFIAGTIILSIGLYATYRYNYSNIIQQELRYTASIVDEVSVNFGQLLIEKIKTNQTLSIAPILTNAVKTSNNTLSNFSEKERNEIIYHQDEKWQAIKDENNEFILEYTDNNVAQFLKAQQNYFKGEYGEIFLTNKYGALIASTSKLTTFAHANKYWWQGAYNNGLGTVFIDDRGYDESVNGYVLGFVIPLKEDDQIIGMLKVNLNILGAISEINSNSQSDDAGDYKLIRSDGEIIFEEGIPSLTTQIPNLLYQKLLLGDEHSLLFYDSDKKWMIGKSEISITSKNYKSYIFGGSFESKDHKDGNSGEAWFIINYRNLTTILKPLKDSVIIILGVGFLLIIILAYTAFVFGKAAVKPLKQIIDQSKKIAKTDFSGRIVVTRKDEIGLLGEAFNTMAEELEKTTTSMNNLELSEHKILQQNKDLQKLNATKDKFFSIIAHDLKGPFNSILGFSDLLNKNFDEYDTEKKKKFLNIIHREIQNTYKLIENLLLWSLSQRGDIDFKTQKINLYLLVNETCELLNASAKRKTIKLICQIPEDIDVDADKNMLSTIIRNFISNAVKFTSKGGEITIKARLISTQINQKFTEIAIEDNGIGISKEIQSKLFNVSENTSSKGTENESGTGLGLILCKEFIEKHGGEIRVESELDKGSKFIFTLPVVL